MRILNTIEYDGEILGFEVYCFNCDSTFTLPVKNKKYNKIVEHYRTRGGLIYPCVHCPKCDYGADLRVPG